MANGTYGIKKPATITANDVDILYFYRPTRGSDSPDFKGFKKVEDPSTMLYSCQKENNLNINGLYNLRLPLEIFGRKGIYTIYITPNEIETTILDVSTLTGDFSNVRGVIFDTSNLNISKENGSLVGYRMEFLEESGNTTGEYRIITSSNKCEPVSQNMSSSSVQKGIRYRFNDTSELVFCTVTPSTSYSFKSSSFPYIGETGAPVKLVNTKFNPIMLEIEMVNHDIETVSTMLEGAQVRDLANGIITTFDEDGNVYHQAAYGNIVNPDTELNADFKLPYKDNYISSEKRKFEEISEQVNV